VRTGLLVATPVSWSNGEGEVETVLARTFPELALLAGESGWECFALTWLFGQRGWLHGRGHGYEGTLKEICSLTRRWLRRIGSPVVLESFDWFETILSMRRKSLEPGWVLVCPRDRWCQEAAAPWVSERQEPARGVCAVRSDPRAFAARWAEQLGWGCDGQAPKTAPAYGTKQVLARLKDEILVYIVTSYMGMPRSIWFCAYHPALDWEQLSAAMRLQCEADGWSYWDEARDGPLDVQLAWSEDDSHESIAYPTSPLVVATRWSGDGGQITGESGGFPRSGTRRWLTALREFAWRRHAAHRAGRKRVAFVGYHLRVGFEYSGGIRRYFRQRVGHRSGRRRKSSDEPEAWCALCGEPEALHAVLGASLSKLGVCVGATAVYMIGSPNAELLAFSAARHSGKDAGLRARVERQGDLLFGTFATRDLRWVTLLQRGVPREPWGERPKLPAAAEWASDTEAGPVGMVWVVRPDKVDAFLKYERLLQLTVLLERPDAIGRILTLPVVAISAGSTVVVSASSAASFERNLVMAAACFGARVVWEEV